jgi:hypothetical protein
VSKVLLECIKNEVIPHEIVEELRDIGTTFYEGLCAIQCAFQWANRALLTPDRLLDCTDL